MQVVKTNFKDLVEIVPSVFKDSRGWFIEFYKEETFRKAGISDNLTHTNISFSNKGVVRGLHFQFPPYSQTKLVSVLVGKVLDVVVDLRKESETFGQVYTCVLDATKHNLLLVPAGFAHGFAALEDSLFIYKTSNIYNPQAESGIIWNDPTLKIDWPFSDPILSDKDRNLPSFKELLGKSLISRG